MKNLKKRAARIAKKHGLESSDVLWLLEGGMRKGETIRFLKGIDHAADRIVVCDMIGDTGRR